MADAGLGLAEGAASEDDLAAAWAALCAGACVTGEMEPDGRHMSLFLDLAVVPPALAGRRLRPGLGGVALMSVPLRAGPARFGPARLTLAEALRHAGAPLRLEMADLPPLPPGETRGAALQAMAPVNEPTFFEKVQLHHSRHTDPVLLRLGARAGYRCLPSFQVRAAALTVLAHRVLERDLRHLTADDHAEARWLREQGQGVVAEGRAMLADSAAPAWTTVRWTTSLATVCALLALCQDDVEAARVFYGEAAAQVTLVHVAPVSALNLVNACLMLGLLEGLAGDREAARAALERGVRAFQPCVAAQDIMANIWVLGDIIEVARAARQCYLALGKFGLLPPRATPRMHADTPLDLRQTASAVPRILQAGLCPGLAEGLAALDAARP